MPFLSRRTVFRLLAVIALATFSQVHGEEKPAPKLVYLVTRKNEVRPIELEPRMSVLSITLSVGGYDSKTSMFHHWRHTQRKPVPWVHDPMDLDKIQLQPNDVIIEGWLDETRAKFIEHIPEISAALKLPAHAAPAEVNKVFDF